jgi:hypothetical protein
LFVAYIGVFGLLTAFGNITDYGSNFAFVQHVMSMDTDVDVLHLDEPLVAGGEDDPEVRTRKRSAGNTRHRLPASEA